MMLKNIQTQLVIKWEFLKPLQILELFQLYLKTVFKGQNIHFLTVNRNCILSARLGTEKGDFKLQRIKGGIAYI